MKLLLNKIVFIDKEDYSLISRYSWSVGVNGYVYGYLGNYKRELLHRFLLKPSKVQHIDHINGNPLDNRRKNLRICTRSQNLKNTGKKKHNTSGYKWVSWSVSNGGWVIRMRVGKKYIWGGTFKDKLEASKRANELAVSYFGEFAKW